MSTAGVDAPAKSRAGLSGMAAFHLVNAGQFVSIAGTGLTRFALGVWIYQRSGSATLFALTELFGILPLVLLGPFAGALVDRWRRKPVLLAGDSGAALSTLALAVLLYAGRLEMWHVYVATALSSAFSAFQGPAFSATIPLLVGKENLARASGAAQLAGGVAQIVAPGVAGLLVAVAGIHGVLFVDFVTFLFAIAALAAVRIPEVARDGEAARERKSLVREALRGWTYLAERRGLLGLVVLFGATNYFMGVVLALATPLVLSTFRPAALGSVMTISGLGMLAGSLALGRLAGPGRRSLRVLAFTAVAGLSMALAGLRPSLALIGAAAFGFFFAMQVVSGCFRVIVQSKVAPEIQGRVFSLSALVANSTLPLAFATAGPLADRLFTPALLEGGSLVASLGPVVGVGPGRGIGLLFVVMGAMTMVAVGVGLASPRIRRLDVELPDAIPDGGGAPLASAVDVSDVEPEAAPVAAPAYRSPRLAVALVAGLALVAVAACAVELTPPAVVPASAPPTAFSAERAAPLLARVASEPHPVGSAAHARVRDELVSAFGALGIEVEVQRTPAVAARFGRETIVADVENVVARVRGTASTGTVMLTAHYDSVPTGPGAADDGAAVAALVETARALASGPRTRNDVVFLLADAEEIGSLGARAYARTAADPGRTVVLNFEARGTSGPSLLFDASDGDRWLVDALAPEVERPLASSLFREAYRFVPNGTDLPEYEAVGMQGLNFAFVGDPVNYHSVQDGPASLDPRSLQHHGEYALAAARAFGNADLGAARTHDDAVYFSALGRALVRYPASWALPLAVVAALLLAAVVGWGVRAGRIRPRALAAGAALFVIATAGSALAVAFFGWIVAALRVTESPVTWSDAYHAWRFELAFVLVATAITAVAAERLGRFAGGDGLLGGTLACWAALALATAAWLPGASYAFAWPLVAATAGLAVALRARRGAGLAATAACAAPGGAVFAPLAALLFVGLTLVASWAVAGIAAAAIALAGPVFAAGGRAARLGAAGLAAVAAVLLAWGCLDVAYDGAHRRPDSLFYALDASDGRATWASTDAEPDAFTSRFLGAAPARASLPLFFPASRFPYAQAEATAVALAAPVVAATGDDLAGSTRTVRLHVDSPRGAPVVQLAVRAQGALASCRVNGAEVATDGVKAGEWTTVRYWSPPADGFDVDLALDANGPVDVWVADQSFGLPAALASGSVARDPGTMPVQYGYGVTDVTLVGRRYAF